MNGVASGGTGITVDGTEANSNPEGRSLTQYGSGNQISILSLDAIAEIQIVKGVLPAEYGGVAGGQINVISRSGTNNFRGSAFSSFQNEKWNARDFFSTSDKPVGAFKQYGGTLGGPVLRNKVFFFSTYEGYRERVDLNLNTTVPYPAVRDEILRALPMPETRIVFDAMYLPTEPIVSSAGVVNPQVGRWRGLGVRRRSENHVVAKTDMALFNGANLTLTYSRLRPFTLEPRPNPLNTAGLTRVPVVSRTGATTRPGTYIWDMARGPGKVDLHTTFAKSFNVGGERRLQLRADMLNVLNRKNYNNPVMNMNSADFGRITGAGGRRVVQLGARLTF